MARAQVVSGRCKKATISQTLEAKMRMILPLQKHLDMGDTLEIGLVLQLQSAVRATEEWSLNKSQLPLS